MADTQLTVGDVIAGKYRIESTIGEGGMGTVLAAVDEQLERPVAIKLLLAEHLANPEVKARFLREARAAVKIGSEHVARVYEVGTLPSGAPFMVMERLRGSDLASVLEREGPLQVRDATLFVIQACEAIAEAHAAGIVHRDLKPANLFLARLADGSSSIKVLDFGISKVIAKDQASSQLSLTQTRALLGSPLYMAPEQLRTPRDVDQRCDIWAMGSILYELLAGTPPFNAETLPQVTAQILLEAPAPLAERRRDVPAELEQVIVRALSKKPEERQGSIGEFALALVPFASRRARVTMERIAGLQRQGGMSGLELPPSMAPAAAPAMETTTLSATGTAWGSTEPGGGSVKARTKRVALGAAALLAVLGLVGTLAAVGGTNDAPSKLSRSTAMTRLAARPPLARATEPAVTSESPAPANPPPEAPEAPSAPAPSSSADGVAAPRPAPTRRITARPQRRPRKAQARTARSQTAVTDLRKQYGDRE